MKLKYNSCQIILVCLLSLFWKGVNAQTGPCAPANRAVISSCSEVWSVSLSGAGSYNSAMCGYNTPGNELVFEYTALVTGIHSIAISNMTGSSWVDFGWRLASSGCVETGWTCIDDVFSNGNYGAMSWTAGTTYYLIIDPESNSAVSFDFKLNCPNVATEASECANAVSICSNASFAVDPNGYGTINEIPAPSNSSISNPNNPSAAISGTSVGGGANSGCLLSGETNSTWMIINVLTAGLLEFSFGDYQAWGNYFDWAMWPYSPTACASITGNTLAPVRCNWNGTALSFTGIASPANIASLQGTFGSTSITNNFAPALSVASNTQYVICFSNWSSAQTNVPLNFFGTAGISCLPLGDFSMEVFGFKEQFKNKLKWNVANEHAVLNYTVERRAENGEWQRLALQDVLSSNGSLNQYEFTDETPIRGENYYRIVQQLINGSTKQSEIVTIEQELEGLALLSVYPNPVGEKVHLKYSAHEAGTIELQIVDVVGSIIYSETLNAVSGISISSIDVSEFGSGTFLIQLVNSASGEKQFSKFVKN